MPYFRDAIQALKNGYKGIKNDFVFFDLIFSGKKIQYLVMPAGILLGVISAFNRMWLRKMKDDRKDAKKHNDYLIDNINKKLPFLDDMLKNINPLSADSWKETSLRMIDDNNKIRQVLNAQYQPLSSSSWLYAYLPYVSVAYNALLDAPYLCFGALTLATLPVSSWLFLIVAAGSLLQAVDCVVTRLYEEYNSEREFLVTQIELELAMSVWQLKVLRGELDLVYCLIAGVDSLNNQYKLHELETRQRDLYESLKATLRNAEQLQIKLNEQSALSMWSLFLCGLKNGSDAYSALASCMFAIATINLMLLIPYSPWLVAGFVLTGMISTLFFVALALISPSLELLDKPKKNASSLSTSMFEFFTELKTLLSVYERGLDSQARHLPNEEARPNVITADPSSQFFFQDWFEIFRSFGSGLGKGIRAVESLFVALQELSQDGHYHDTDSMLIFAWIDAVIFAVIFALRGLARLGRDKINDDPNPKNIPVATEPNDVTEDTDGVINQEDADSLSREPSPSTPRGDRFNEYENAVFVSNYQGNFLNTGLISSQSSSNLNSIPHSQSTIFLSSSTVQDLNSDHYTF